VSLDALLPVLYLNPPYSSKSEGIGCVRLKAL
jgi:hypothetical protein